MTLPDYLKREGLTASAFAESMGMPSSTITRILSGKRSPGFDVIKRISNATNGEVARPEDFEFLPSIASLDAAE